MKPKSPESPQRSQIKKQSQKKNSPEGKEKVLPQKAILNPKGGAKGKQQEEEENVEEVIPPPEKVKNLERFIYVTVYNDSEHMIKLKELFEEINQEAFQLKSVKEIYTIGLTEEERDDNEIDYVSGCQLIDKDRRITLIEGITGKAMVKVKEKFPKTQMNSATYKVFADSNVLFNKRIYSKFDLSLKYIKLRDPLNIILTTYDIYGKANKMRDIYNAFLSFGSILKASTMLELSNWNVFPNADSLLLLERKYADILTEEDLTAVHTVKKPKKRIRIDSIERSSVLSVTSQSADLQTKPLAVEPEPEEIEKGRSRLKGSTDSHNLYYEEYLKKHHPKRTWGETMEGNFEYLKTMKRKPPQAHFCQPMPKESYAPNEVVNLYSSMKDNYYEKYLDFMREKYAKDKDHYYTYSQHSLAFSFPLLPKRNYEYLEYLDNKSKWVDKNNFERYQQPKREYIFFPKINNVL